MGGGLFGMFGPTVLNPVARLTAVLALDLTPEPWVGLPADPAVNLLPLIFLLSSYVVDSACLLSVLLSYIVRFLTEYVRHYFFQGRNVGCDP